MNDTLTRCSWCMKLMIEDGGFTVCEHCDSTEGCAGAPCARCQVASEKFFDLSNKIANGE